MAAVETLPEEYGRELSESDDQDGFVSPLPGHKIHRCTDPLWSFIFLLSLLGQVAIHAYAAQHGDLRRLFHGSDFLGRTCGVDAPGDYVFWCRLEVDDRMDIRHPVCAEACPAGPATSRQCYDPSNGEFIVKDDYATRAIGRYCVPAAAKSVGQVFENWAGKRYVGQVHHWSAQIYRARLSLYGAAAISVVAASVYLVLAHICPNMILYLGTLTFTGIPLVGGFWLLRAVWFSDGGRPVHDSFRDIGLGCFFVTVGTFVLITGIVALRHLKRAVGCIRASVDCMMEERTLLVQPFITLACRTGLVICCGRDFLLLVSCGARGRRGIKRTFEFGTHECFLLAYSLIVICWANEFYTSCSQYSLAWVTQKWYFTPFVNGSKSKNSPSCAIFQALANGLWYHSGTLAFGSFLTTLLRIPHTIVMFVSAFCRHTPKWLVRFRVWMATKNAYMNVALSSDGFCVSASRARYVLESQGSAVVVLNGAQWIFLLTSHGAVTCVGVMASVCLLITCTSCNEEGTGDYVTDSLPVAICGGLVGYYISSSLMLVFDMAGDTILYCFLLDQQRKQEQSNLLKISLDREESRSWATWLLNGGLRCTMLQAEEYESGEVLYTPAAVQEILRPMM